MLDGFYLQIDGALILRSSTLVPVIDYMMGGFEAESEIEEKDKEP